MSKCILYIYFGGDFSWLTSGVQKKVFSKVNAINQLGYSCDCISFSSSVNEEKIIDTHFKILPIIKSNNRKFFNSLLEHKNYYLSLSIWLENNGDKYDAILMRYPLSSKFLYQLVKKFNNKIIFEHNTKELEEILITQKQDRQKIPFSMKPGYFIYYFEIGVLPYLLEKYFAPKVFENALLGVSVTGEISEYENQRCSSYKNVVITNSIDVDSCVLRKPQTITENTIRLFILTGANVPWHGVERILNGLTLYKGPLKFKVDVIGSYSDEQVAFSIENNITESISFIKHIEYNNLNEILDKYHAGIGTLAAFRKGLDEASPLKVREYFARGFPCIIGYNDTDLMQYKDFKPYYLQVPSDETPLDFNAIEKFIIDVYKDKQHPQKIRGLAMKYLDTKVKMKQLVTIISEKLNHKQITE